MGFSPFLLCVCVCGRVSALLFFSVLVPVGAGRTRQRRGQAQPPPEPPAARGTPTMFWLPFLRVECATITVDQSNAQSSRERESKGRNKSHGEPKRQREKKRRSKRRKHPMTLAWCFPVCLACLFRDWFFSSSVFGWAVRRFRVRPVFLVCLPVRLSMSRAVPTNGRRRLLSLAGLAWPADPGPTHHIQQLHALLFPPIATSSFSLATYPNDMGTTPTLLLHCYHSTLSFPPSLTTTTTAATNAFACCASCVFPSL